MINCDSGLTGTMLAAPPPTANPPSPTHYVLMFDDGRSLTVSGHGVIGRDPAVCGLDVQHVVTLGDEALVMHPIAGCPARD